MSVYDLLRSLSRSELEVLQLVSRGFRYAKIAGILGCTENAAKARAHRAMCKLGVHNRLEAAIFVRHTMAAMRKLTK